MNLNKLATLIKGTPQNQLTTLKQLILNASQVVLLGNGGSNAIASHMAVDYVKFFGKKCYVPNASDLMSMIVNDYGADDMYSKFLEYNYVPNQLTIIISSSGNSANVVNAALKCDELNTPMVLLSGFDQANKLNMFESENVKLKYWVDSDNYGEVEMAHHIFLHAVV